MATKVRGLDQVKKRLRYFGDAYPKALEAGLQQEGRDLLSKTSVPRRTGELQDSAFVSEPEGRGTSSKVSVGFTAKHGSPVNKRTRFFSKPFARQKRGYVGRLAKHTQKNVDTKVAPSGEERGVATKTARKRRRST